MLACLLIATAAAAAPPTFQHPDPFGITGVRNYKLTWFHEIDPRTTSNSLPGSGLIAHRSGPGRWARTAQCSRAAAAGGDRSAPGDARTHRGV